MRGLEYSLGNVFQITLQIRAKPWRWKEHRVTRGLQEFSIKTRVKKSMSFRRKTTQKSFKFCRTHLLGLVNELDALSEVLEVMIASNLSDT